MKDQIAAESQLRDAGERFCAELQRATEDQWRFRPVEAEWCMADVAEHVTITNRNVHRLLSGRLLATPIGGEKPAVIDVEIPFLFFRGEEPPGVATPTGTWIDRRAAAEAVAESASAISRWARDATVDLRTFGSPHPAFGLLDGVQWLLFAAAHLERHRSQLIGLARRAADAPLTPAAGP